MPKIYLNVEVNTESLLGRIAEAKEHLSAAEDILRDTHWWDAEKTISAKEATAPEGESDAAATCEITEQQKPE